MKKKSIWVMERIGAYLILYVGLTILLTVIHKLIFNYEDWLWLSLSWSTVFVATLPFKKFIIKKKDNLSHKILNGTLASACVFFLIAFALGVVMNMSDWLKYTFDITAPFAFSLALGVPLGESHE